MHCVKCGEKVSEKDEFCQNCGCIIIRSTNSEKLGKPNKISLKHIVIGVFFPPLGFALWGLYIKEDPLHARNYLLFSLIGTLCYIVGFIAAMAG